MTLDVNEVARILSVSKKTVYRLIAKNEIPAHKIGEVYRFDRAELLHWANTRKMQVSYEIFDEPPDAPNAQSSLTAAIHAGGIHYRVQGTDKESVISNIVRTMQLSDDIDRDFLIGALVARENLGSTAIGDGIAIPHIRNPIVFHVNQPVLALCFLEHPIDFGAIDGKPVDTVFTIITHAVRSHLYILSRLSYVLQQKEIRRVITSLSTPREIMDTLDECEKKLNKNIGK